MGDCQQTGKPSRYVTNTQVNSAFHPSGVGKSSTILSGALTCDLIWQVEATLHSSEMGYHHEPLTTYCVRHSTEWQHSKSVSELVTVFSEWLETLSDKKLAIVGPAALHRNCADSSVFIIIIIIIKEIYIAPFHHTPKALCKQKVKWGNTTISVDGRT